MASLKITKTRGSDLVVGSGEQNTNEIILVKIFVKKTSCY